MNPNPMYYGESKGGLESLPLQRPAQPIPVPDVQPTNPGRRQCSQNPDGDYHCLHLGEHRKGAHCCWCGKHEDELHGPYAPWRKR